MAVPAGALHDGTNHLAIVPPKENDDIVVREIKVVSGPIGTAIHEATLELKATESTGNIITPCRFTIVSETGTLPPLVDADEGKSARPLTMAIRPGVIYSATGRARVGLPRGRYVVYASRGFEWSVAKKTMDLTAGSASVSLEINREVATPGWVSCDTHVHTLTHSGHGDATIDERMITLAGEGIDLPVATDHNINIDYSDPVRRTGLFGVFTAVTGNEVTTPAGHFNIFPVTAGSRPPDFHQTNWPALMEELRATPSVKVVILNHPRNIHGGFQPFAPENFNALSGENLRGPEFTFDAMEILNSSAQQSDYMLVIRDWFALLNYGYKITAVGSSDSHDVSRYIVGQSRTYIAADDSDPSKIDIGNACSNLLAGRALVSMGLLIEPRVNGRFGVGELATNLSHEVSIESTVRGPSWVHAARVELFANGKLVAAEDLKNSAKNPPGIQGVVRWVLPRPKHDVHWVVVAAGPGVEAAYWKIPRPYQPTSKTWTGHVIGVANPIWLDADGDGKFSAAKIYAERVIEAAASSAEKLISRLRDYDEATAIQAASLWKARGKRLDSEELKLALKGAPDWIQRGFAEYTESTERLLRRAPESRF
jgi:hypothetical protein